MKNLVICLDGTGNQVRATRNTNVVLLYQMLDLSDPARQVAYYDPGLGTFSSGAAWTPVGKRTSQLSGLAFGTGLRTNLGEAYTWLMQNWEPGDEIFVFGFSRGAYTARSVAGMVGRVGLLTKVSLVEERLPTAVHMYQRIDGPEGAFGASAEEFKHDHCHSARVNFLGVFDTVGALGVPGLQAVPRFHDVQLSGQVLRARHALAIDETRLKFAPTFWEAPEGDAGAPT